MLDYEVMMNWTEELAAVVHDERRIVNKRGVLPIVVSAQELNKWVNDPRRYSKSSHFYAWRSSIEDFRGSYDSLGPAVGHLLKRRVTNLYATIGRLPLGNENAMCGPGGLRLRKQINNQINNLLLRISEQRILLASWEDTITVVKNDVATPDDVRIARDIFVDIASHHKKDMETFGLKQQISELLTSQKDILDISFEAVEKIKAEDFTEDARLDLCRKQIVATPEAIERTIWLEINRASLHRSHIELGDVSLYESEWLMGQNNHDTNLEKLPSEFRANQGRFGKYTFTGEKGNVLVRVSLPPGLISEAYYEAASILSALIQLGHTNHGRDWIIAESYLVFVDDREVSSRGSRRHEIEAEYNFHTDSMSEQWERNNLTSLTVNSDIVDTRLPELLKLVAELDSVLLKDARTRLLAATKLLEHLTGWTDDSVRWYTFANSYLKHAWSRKSLIDELSQQVTGLLFSSINFSHKETAQLANIRARVIPEYHRTFHTFNRARAITNLTSLSKINNNAKRARSFDWLVNIFKDGRTLHSELTRRDKQFEQMFERLVRYRNALEHGGPRQDLVAESVADFAVEVASLAISEVIPTFLEGKDLKAGFTRRAAVLDRKYANLASNGEPVRILGDR